MDQSFLQLVLSQTGLGGIAVFAMWQLKALYEDRLRREKEINETLRQDRAELIAVSKELVKTLSNLENAVEGLTNEFGRSAPRGH